MCIFEASGKDEAGSHMHNCNISSEKTPKSNVTDRTLRSCHTCTADMGETGHMQLVASNFSII